MQLESTVVAGFFFFFLVKPFGSAKYTKLGHMCQQPNAVGESRLSLRARALE